MPSRDAQLELQSLPCGLTHSVPDRLRAHWGNYTFSHMKWGLDLGKRRPDRLGVGCGRLDSIGREKKMNFIIRRGAREPAIICVWE